MDVCSGVSCMLECFVSPLAASESLTQRSIAGMAKIIVRIFNITIARLVLCV